MILTADIRSTLKPEHVYGKKGDTVFFIADHGNVVCVEGPNGKKFAVHKKYIDEYSEADYNVPDEIKPAPEAAATIVHKAPVSNAGKKRRAVPLNNQTTIFQ
jgi:hypothetical protein